MTEIIPALKEEHYLEVFCKVTSKQITDWLVGVKADYSMTDLFVCDAEGQLNTSDSNMTRR